jgi:hypothetical protein
MGSAWHRPQTTVQKLREQKQEQLNYAGTPILFPRKTTQRRSR